MLQSKRKLMPKPPTNKSVRDLLSAKRRTLNAKENTNTQARTGGRKLSRPYF